MPAASRTLNVIRHRGGDDVFAADDAAHQAALEGVKQLALRWPGRLVMEGLGDETVGESHGEWTYIVDPVDGTRPWSAGKRSAWCLLGAGRNASRLEDLEIGVAIELPIAPALTSIVTWAVRGGQPTAVEERLDASAPARSVDLTPFSGDKIERTFVTVMRFSPGNKGRIGDWEDELLGDLETY